MVKRPYAKPIPVLSAFFTNPAACFSETDAETIGEIVASAADLALILDANGVVLDVAGRHGGIEELHIATWPGQKLADIIGAATWPALHAVMTSRNAAERARGVTITHQAEGGECVIDYVPVSIGATDNTLLLGQNRSQTAHLRDQLARLQQFIETRINRQKEEGAQYRALFALGPEAPPARPETRSRLPVGQAPLREMVRAQVDAFEKDCIEAALKLTGNNRAATAKVLGLSRQGLYDKLRRYGIMSD